MSLQRETQLGRNSAQHLLRSADENLKAKEEMMFLSFEAPWWLPNQVLLAQNYSGRELRDLWAAKPARASRSHLTIFSAPHGAAGLLCTPKKSSSAKGLSLACCRCQSKRWSPQEVSTGLAVNACTKGSFCGEILALEPSSVTPADAEVLQENG